MRLGRFGVLWWIVGAGGRYDGSEQDGKLEFHATPIVGWSDGFGVEMMERPIFIVGLHRTGSTLWHNLISMSPGILRLTDPRFLGDAWHRSFNYFLRTSAGDLWVDENVDLMVEMCFSRKGIPGLESTFWRFENVEVANDPALKRAISRKIKESNRSLGAIARIFLEEMTRLSGYQRACVKFPVDIVHVPRLIEWFPDCRIIHTTRDPRALAMSKTNDPSGTALKVQRHPRLAWLIKKATLLYEVLQYRRTAKLHGRYKHLENYRLFRYEDLLAETERTLREMCDFAEIEFIDAMLEPQKGRHNHQFSSLTGKQQKGFDAEAAVRWQTVISPVSKWIITALTSKSMFKLGYDPRTHAIFSRAKRGLHPASDGASTDGASSSRARDAEYVRCDPTD